MAAPTGGAAFSGEPNTIWTGPVGWDPTPPEVQRVRALQEEAAEAAEAAAEAAASPDPQADAVEVLMDLRLAGKRKRRSERDERALLLREGTPEQRERVLREEMDRARDAQREALYEELSRLTHSGLRSNLHKLVALFESGGLQRDANERTEARRRNALMLAVAQTVAVWPSCGGDASVQLCGYDALLVAAGPDNFSNFCGKTAAARAAMAALFDGQPFCDTLDTALLCLDHDAMRKSETVACYIVFDHFAQALLGAPAGGAPTEDRRLLAFVHGRRSGADRPPRHPWGVWGDQRTRVVCGKCVRVLEGLLRQALDWDALAGGEFAAVTQPVDVPSGPAQQQGAPPQAGQQQARTGALLVEKWDGALAAELVSFLWRAFHRDASASLAGLDPADALPPLGDAPRGDPSWANAFPTTPGLAGEEAALDAGRAYLHRLLYTCHSHPETRWFLRGPAAVVLYTLLEQAAPTAGFMSASLLGPRLDETSLAARALAAHRQIGIDAADGKTFGISRNLAITIGEFRRRKPGARLPAAAYPEPARQPFLRRVLGAAHLGFIYDHPKLFTVALGVILVVGGVWVFVPNAAVPAAAELAGAAAATVVEGVQTATQVLVTDPVETAMIETARMAANQTLGEAAVMAVDGAIGLWVGTRDGMVWIAQGALSAAGLPTTLAQAAGAVAEGMVYAGDGAARAAHRAAGAAGAAGPAPTGVRVGGVALEQGPLVGSEGEAVEVMRAIRWGSNTVSDPSLPLDAPVTQVGHSVSEMHGLVAAGWMVQNPLLDDEDLVEELTPEASAFLADMVERNDGAEIARTLSAARTRSGRVYRRAVLKHVARGNSKRPKPAPEALAARLDLVAPLSTLCVRGQR